MKKFFQFRGFTLIEMVIVIGILGIIAMVALAAINPVEQLKKSTDTKRKSDLAQFRRALDLYYNDNGRYPASATSFKIVVNGVTLDWGTQWQPYINKIPKDPNVSRTYQYYSPAASNGQTYYIYASLERGGKDPQACNGGSACTSITTGGAGYPASNSCGGTCNYGVSSANVLP